ncbi:MAG: metal-dependent transcriptional regulator, partial [Gemmatimonadaceae bacterium]|nr:metal-dependent transcriptional regulator [Gemmatimonadaceae bacterium]
MSPARQAGLSHSVEDYLKAIYEAERDGPAPTNTLAARLGVAPASVSGMLTRLAAQKLVTVERYRGARLTAAGRKAALALIRRHRILETYLVAMLGIGWDEVHAEAERLEHAASPKLIERMAEALGHPAVDPHGAPIPGPDGAVRDGRLRTLAA